MPVVANPVIEKDLAEIIERDLPWEALAGTRVLVTGAAGMLPSYMLYTLLALNDRRGLGIEVHGLVRNADTARAALADVLDRPDLRLVVQDVCDSAEPAYVDWIIHGASPARPALHGANPVGTLRVNIVGTMNMLDICRANPGSGLLLMSSSEVYGSVTSRDGLIGEDDYGGLDILSARACYPEGKRAAEALTSAYGRQYGVPVRIARLAHVYGPGMASDDGRVQADFAANVASGQDIVLNSDGSALRTYTYVADAVAALFYVLLLGDDHAYNVADERGLISIRELATAFTRTRPERALRLSFTGAAGNRSTSSVQAQGLRSGRLAALGWRPWVDLRTGLDRMVTAFEYVAGSGTNVAEG